MCSAGETNQEKFFQWLSVHASLAKLHGLYRTYDKIDEFCRSRNIIDAPLFEITDILTLLSVKNIVEKHKVFREPSQKILSKKMSEAICYYISYLEEESNQLKENNHQTTTEDNRQLKENSCMLPPFHLNEDVIPQKAAQHIEIDETTANHYIVILEENFSDGLRPMVIHFDKFKLLYEQQFGESIHLDNDALRQQLEQVGLVIDGRIFAKKNFEEAAIIKKIHHDIVETFNNGASCIFLERLMERYQQELADEIGVYNKDTLAELLLSQCQSLYHREEDYLRQQYSVANFAQEVREVLKHSPQPMNYEQIQEQLWYLPMSKIKNTLVAQASLVNISRETYFYAPNLPITDDELLAVTNLMHQQIAEKGFLTAKDFPVILEQAAPAVLADTGDFKDWGLRNAFSYLLLKEFNFSNSLVCEKGNAVDIGWIYRNYCRQYEQMGLEELKEFSEMIGYPIYWEDVFQEMVRVSRDKFVRKDHIAFDVAAVDDVLNTFCTGDYLPIWDIRLFSHFPVAEFVWNGFLLESFLINYSQQFNLYQASIAERNYYGVIVRKSSPFADYSAVVLDTLVHSQEWNDQKSALDLLVQKGYQARRSLKNIDELTKAAVLKQEQLKKEK